MTRQDVVGELLRRRVSGETLGEAAADPVGSEDEEVARGDGLHIGAQRRQLRADDPTARHE